MTWWLEAGEDGSDRIDLMSGASGAAGYSVMSQGFDIVPDAEDPDRFQILSIPLLIKGSSKNDLFNKRRAILTKLSQASFNRQPGSGQPRVTIAIRFGDADTLVRWVIESGNLTRGNLGAITTNHLGSMAEPALLQLRCWRGGLGERVDYGPFTVTGADPTLHINGVPGDLPGVLEVHVEDTSTNSVAVNRLIWACRSLPDMADGDFDPVLPFNTNDDSVPDTFTGGIATISASSTWQTIGSVSRAASAHDGGVFDVYCRLRDASSLLGSPIGVDATITSGITLVQADGLNNSSTTSLSPTWDAETSAGSLLLLHVQCDSNRTITPPDGWTLAESSGTTYKVALYYIEDAAPRSGAEEVTFSGTCRAFVRLYEWAGITASSALDQTASATSSSTTSHPTGTTSATAQDYELVITMHMTAPGIFSPENYTAGYTSLHSTPSAGVATYYKITTATGAQSATLTSDSSGSGAGLVATFKGIASDPPELPAGTYIYRIAAVSGSNATASTAVSVQPAGVGAVRLTWAAPGPGTPTTYRVYWKRDSESWKYLDTSSTHTNYMHTTESGATTEDPPGEESYAQFRAFIGRENSVTQQPPMGPFTASVANSEWEWVYLRRVHLPPSSTPGVADMTDWTLVLQGRADTSTQLDADAILLLPADENSTVDACYPPNSLTTPHEWHVWATPQGVPGGYLTDGVDEAGNLRVRGVPSIGPGDTTMTFVPSVAGGISNVEDVEFDVQVYVWPRYEWLVGEV